MLLARRAFKVPFTNDRLCAVVGLFQRDGACRRQSPLPASRKKDYDGAITAFTAVLALDPTVIGGYANRGIAHGHKLEYELAIADDTQALKLNPALFNVLSTRCYHRALQRQGFDEALADCNASLKIKPNNIDALNSRGLTYFLMGKYDLAKADYDKGLASGPVESVLYRRGILKNRLGDAAGGKADIDAALKLDKDAGDELTRAGILP